MQSHNTHQKVGWCIVSVKAEAWQEWPWSQDTRAAGSMFQICAHDLTCTSGVCYAEGCGRMKIITSPCMLQAPPLLSFHLHLHDMHVHTSPIHTVGNTSAWPYRHIEGITLRLEAGWDGAFAIWNNSLIFQGFIEVSNQEAKFCYVLALSAKSSLRHMTPSTAQQQSDRLNSIMAVRCAETPEVWANSSVYTPESLSQTKTNRFIGFQELVCCDCPIAFEVSHRFMLFIYSCSFFPWNHHGVFR